MVKRLFIALDLSEELAGLLAGLDPGVEGLRWTPLERLHLTLCFLGNVEGDAQARLDVLHVYWQRRLPLDEQLGHDGKGCERFCA